MQGFQVADILYWSLTVRRRVNPRKESDCSKTLSNLLTLVGNCCRKAQSKKDTDRRGADDERGLDRS